ncbi:Gfo/Idh/MocA family oxidoreductase [Pararcticibacter amylolyticus]|nr:Gfo/Idh/MocA family oxidoreductase [Pararcticibacter amylolyticus]
MDQPIVTGILSYGMSGRVFHAPFVNANPGFRLYAVTERSSKNAQKRYPEIISYNSVEELLNDQAIELVIVNTPNNTHFEYALKALQAGKHVLVEKPFAATSAEAKQLFDLGREKGCKVMVYQNRRWDSDFQQVKSVIRGGLLGDPMEVYFRYDRYRREISQKTFKEENLPASGLTYDLGPHLLDQAISIFGKPASFSKTTGIFRPGSQVDDYVHFHLKYEGGLNVFLTSSLLVAQPLPSFVVHGTEGTFIKSRTDVQEAQLEKGISPLEEGYGVEPDGSEGQLTTIDKEGNKQSQYLTSLRSTYNHLFQAVFSCIRKNEPFPVSEEEIIWQMEILES